MWLIELAAVLAFICSCAALWTAHLHIALLHINRNRPEGSLVDVAVENWHANEAAKCLSVHLGPTRDFGANSALSGISHMLVMEARMFCCKL